MKKHRRRLPTPSYPYPQTGLYAYRFSLYIP
jgi:hypothetical protein